MFKSLPSAVKPFALRCCAYTFIAQLAPLVVMYLLYMRDTGLSPAQIGFVVSVWFIIGLIFELPSSVIADRFSRRHVLMTGEITSAIGFCIMWLYPNWWGFLIGVSFWGLRGALYSGTFEAYVYDELKTLDEADSFKTLLGLNSSCLWAGLFASSFMFGLYNSFGISAIALISISTRLISAFIIGTGPEVAKQQLLSQSGSLQIMKQAFQTLRSDSKLIFLFVLGQAVSQMMLIFNYRLLIFEELGLPKKLSGFLLAFTYAAPVLGSLYGARIKFAHWRHFVSFVSVPLLFLVFFSVVHQPYVAIGCLFISLITQQIWHIQKSGYIHDKIPSKSRATLGSLTGFLELLTIIMSNVLGLTTGVFGYQKAMISLVVPSVVVVILYGIFKLVYLNRKSHV